MSLWSLADISSLATSGFAFWEIINGANNEVRVMEIGITLQSSATGGIGLGFPPVAGVTPGGLKSFVAEDPNDVSVANQLRGATSWGTGPTVPTSYIRRAQYKPFMGLGTIWSFPFGLVIPASKTLAVYNTATNPTFEMYAVIEL